MDATTFLENRLQRWLHAASRNFRLGNCAYRVTKKFSSCPLVTTSFPSFTSLGNPQHAWTSNERIISFFFSFPSAWWTIRFAKDAGVGRTNRAIIFPGHFPNFCVRFPCYPVTRASVRTRPLYQLYCLAIRLPSILLEEPQLHGAG